MYRDREGGKRGQNIIDQHAQHADMQQKQTSNFTHILTRDALVFINIINFTSFNLLACTY